MHFPQIFTTLVALSTYAFASVTVPSIHDLKDTHRVHQVAGGKRLPAPVLYANALVKYGKPVPTNLRIAASAALAATPAATSSSSSSTKAASSSTTPASSSTKVSTTVSTTREVASVTATNRASDIQYLINVTVGGSQLLLNLDTGSSDCG